MLQCHCIHNIMYRFFALVVFAFYCSLSSSYAQSSAELRDSLHILSAELDLHPEDTDLRLRKAAINMLLQEWDNAIYEYDRVLNQNHDNLAALFYRAYANARLRRLSLSRSDYQRLLGILPDHLEARLGLALICQQEKKTNEALDHLNLLIEQHPTSALGYATRAGIEEEEGMSELALYDYDEAIRLEPENTDYLLIRAQLLIKLRQYADARRDLDRIVQLGTPRAALIDYYNQLTGNHGKRNKRK